MTAIAGSIESVTLDGTTFAVAADADVNRKLGGFENEVQLNGDGSARVVKTRMGWKLENVALSIDDSAGDAEVIQDLSNQKGTFAVTITYASGIVYQGDGQFTGDVQTSSQTQTNPLTIEGGGTLTQQ